MPEQSGRTASKDFAFQSTDQAFTHGAGAEQLSKPPYSSTSSDRYHAKTPAPNAPPAPTNQAPALETSLRYPDYAQQSPVQAQPPASFHNVNFSPTGPLVWDWNNSIEFPDFTSQYEPQGELIHELHDQPIAQNDFSIPLPVVQAETVFQSPQSVQTTPAAAVVQNPLDPPPKPAKVSQAPTRLQTGMKRKADSEPNSAASQSASFALELQQPPTKRANKSRSSSSASITSPAVASATDARRLSMSQTTAAVAAPAESTPLQGNNTEAQRRKEQSKGTGPQGRVIDVSKPRKVLESPGGADILPAGKVFPIQIGSELFRLSGASISSDAPSYFSHFFGEQLHNNSGRAGDLRTLYIDRDPETFKDIALHLQGYHVKPRDGEHFVRLFADAQFYSLPRLTKQLFSTDIFIRIGGQPFQIPRDLFSSPGDSPNYFSLGFAQFFSTPSEAFPGLDRNSLLRPPSMQPPSIPNRSSETFSEILRMLQGYNVEIRNEEHRGMLLRDARYFHLKGLEQRLIPCEISFNLKKNQPEVLIRLEDIRQSGVSFAPDQSGSISGSGSGSGSAGSAALSPVQGSKPTSPAPSLHGSNLRAGTVSYARPYTDDQANSNILILEISSAENTTLHFPAYPPTHASSTHPPILDLRATFHAQTLARITSLFSVVSSKMGLPATQPLGLMMLSSGGGVAAQPVSPANSGMSERRVRVRWEEDAYIEIDSQPVELGVDSATSRIGAHRAAAGRRKRAKLDSDNEREAEDLENEEAEWLWGGAKPDDGMGDEEKEWVVTKAHWRLRVEPTTGEGGSRMQIVLCPVRIEGYSTERSRNGKRGFLAR